MSTIIRPFWKEVSTRCHCTWNVSIPYKCMSLILKKNKGYQACKLDQLSTPPCYYWSWYCHHHCQTIHPSDNLISITVKSWVLTCRLFQIAYEGDFWSLHTLTFWQLVTCIRTCDYTVDIYPFLTVSDDGIKCYYHQ